MAVETKALTMDQWAMETNDSDISELTKSILTPHNVMGDLVLANRPDLKVSALRQTADSYQSTYTGWVDINEIPALYEASFEDIHESLMIFGNRFQVHKRFIEQNNWINNPVQSRFTVWKDHMIRDFNQMFFNNDPSDPTNGNRKAITGLRARFATGNPYGTPSVNKIDAAVDFSAMTSTVFNNFIYKLHIALARIGDTTGENTTLYTNFEGKAKLAQGARLAGGTGGFGTMKDSFGRRVDTLMEGGGVKVRDVGFRTDQVTPIIRSTESTAGVDGSGSTYTSMFLVKHGDEGMKGWQPGLPSLTPLGLSKEDGTMHNFIVDGGIGLHQTTRHCIAWLYNIKIS
jgi:hypothetical protein